MQEKPKIHVLVAGLPSLACELYASRRKKPLLLSLDEIGLFGYPKALGKPGGKPIRHTARLWGANLILGMRGEADEVQAQAGLRTFLAETRGRFGLADDAPLRAVAVGSHFSLWHREGSRLDLDTENEHAMPGEACGSRHGIDLDEATINYLEKALHHRTYVNDLHQALTQMGLEFQWLHDFVHRALHSPEPDGRQIAKYAPVATQARADLSTRPWLRSLNGAISLIYTHNDLGWRLFEKQGEALNGNPPSTMTRALLGQFKKFAAGSRHDEAVLVKLLPSEAERWNPCDNPIVSSNDLEMAYAFNVRTVLLDKEKGVIAKDDDHARSDSDPPLSTVLGF